MIKYQFEFNKMDDFNFLNIISEAILECKEKRLIENNESSWWKEREKYLNSIKETILKGRTNDSL